MSFRTKCPTQEISLSTGKHTYCELGSGKRTLLLLHGFSFRPGLYPLALHLKEHFHVVMPDLPFTGKDHRFREHSLPQYVDFLLELVDTLALENVSIFGNSLGGTLALMCDIAAPQRFDSLILRSPLWSAAQLPWYLRIKPLVTAHVYLSMNRFYALRVLELFYKISARVSPVNGAEPQNIIPYDVDSISPRVLSKFLGRLLQVELEPSLSQVSAKSLIVWGEQDTFIPSQWGAALQGILPNADFLEMAGEYHNIATIDVNKLADEIISFLETGPLA